MTRSKPTIRSLPSTARRTIPALIGTTALVTGCLLEFDAIKRFLLILSCVYVLAWRIGFALSRAPTFEIAKRFIVSTGAIAFSVAGLETLALFKILDYRTLFSVPLRKPWNNPNNLLDDELLHIHRPGRYTGRVLGGDISRMWNLPSHREYRFDVHYDANGFRNDAVLSRAHIAVVGDSYIEAPLVSKDGVVTSVISDTLGCNVANFGQAWYGPQQELIVLRRFATKVRPRVCIWAFFEGNDRSDFYRYERVVDNWLSDSAWRHAFPRRSFTRNVAVKSLQLLATSVPDSRAERQFGVFHANGRPVRLYFHYECGKIDSAFLEKLKPIFRSAYESCVEAGSQFVIVFIPTKFRVYRELCAFPENSVCVDWPRTELPATLNIITTQISSEIGFLDLTAALVERARKGDVLYFPDDTHWSASGHKVAGRAISSYVASRMP